jgi:hypothetical protein
MVVRIFATTACLLFGCKVGSVGGGCRFLIFAEFRRIWFTWEVLGFMKSPPYARSLVVPPNGVLRIYTGSGSWSRVQRKHAQGCYGSIVWPCESPAYSFRWPVEGLDVFLFMTSDIGERRVKEFALTMLRNKARMVVIFTNGFECDYFESGSCARVYASKDGLLAIEAVRIASEKVAANG